MLFIGNSLKELHYVFVSPKIYPKCFRMILYNSWSSFPFFWSLYDFGIFLLWQMITDPKTSFCWPLYTIRSVVIFSFTSLYIAYDTGKENLFKWFEASLASVHFLHSHNLLVWCRGNSVRRNWMLVIKKFFLMLEMDHNIVRFVLSQVVSYGPMGHYNCHLDSDLIRPNKPCCHYVGSELGHCRVCR